MIAQKESGEVEDSRTEVSEPLGKRRPGRPRQAEPSAAYLERQAEIVDTATRVFGDRGYEIATLEDVAGRLDLRKASLYHYIKSKSHLLYLIFDRAIGSALAELRTLDDTEDPEFRLAAAVAQQALRVGQDLALFNVFFDARPHLDDHHATSIRELERDYLQVFVEACQAAMDAGVLPAATEPRYAAQAFLGMTSWVYKWFSPERDDVVLFASTCVELVIGRPHPAAVEHARAVVAGSSTP
ncbi:TetR/AcrR family transcriptional regulator [Nitriliruptoraceae bacterium ZYF776]|nr:TetR/AcrR family transcriptional regulator [Profundirhabdus halotolerans]